VREEAGSAWALLATNFPQLVTSAELADGGVWGPWMAATEGSGERGRDAVILEVGCGL
jgi:hypothetical protein